MSHLARAELELGHDERAAELLEWALQLRKALGESEQAQAHDHFRLARALAESDPLRARAEATIARDAYAAALQGASPEQTDREVEEAFEALPEVVMAFVTGVDHPDRGQPRRLNRLALA